jgi:hypothetical protein
MPLSLRRGRVTAIVEEHAGLVRLEVDGAPCVAYPELTGPVAVEDDVLVNTQARELELGSGGFDVLSANLTRGLGLGAAEGAHVMKLPYTPLQWAAPHAEETGTVAETIEGMAVVALSLHSQLAPASAALSDRRVAYVQLAGGALPLHLSDTVRELRRRELLESTISVGPCFGGDLECVTLYSALTIAKARGADVVLCGIGPGIVGTGTRFGHGGMAVVEALDAAVELGGQAVLALRISEADSRDRHVGVSHHSEAILSLYAGSFAVAWPKGLELEHPIRGGADEVDVSDWREACAGLPLSHMGRGPDEEPWFFAAAFAAGRLARSLVA